jgi:acetyl-CoA acetyltransferase
VTAGNSSGLNDGAAALLIASDFSVRHNNLKPLVRIVASAVVGVEPRIMELVSRALKSIEKAGLSMEDMDVIEITSFCCTSIGTPGSWD